MTKLPPLSSSVEALAVANELDFTCSARGECLPTSRPIAKMTWNGVSTGVPLSWPKQEHLELYSVWKASHSPEIKGKRLGRLASRRSMASEVAVALTDVISCDAVPIRRVKTWPVLGARTSSLDYLGLLDEDTWTNDEGIDVTSQASRKTRTTQMKAKSFALGQTSKSFEYLKQEQKNFCNFWSELLQFRFIRRRTMSRGGSAQSLVSVLSRLSRASSAAVSSISEVFSFINEIFSWNASLVDFFSSEGEPVGHIGSLVVFLSMFVACAGIIVAFSDTFGLCFEVYLGLIQLYDWWAPLLSTAASGVLLLHIFDIYDWPCNPGFKCWLVVPHVFLAFFALLFLARDAPEFPLVMALLHVPLSILFLRIGSIGRWSPFLLSIVVNRCIALLSLSCFALWLYLVTSSDYSWGQQTEQRLLVDMAAIFKEYGLQDWSQCEALQPSTHPDEATAAACDKVELIAFLVWTCPALTGAFLFTVCIFLSLRVWHLTRTSEHGEDTNVQRVVFFVVLMVCCIVIAFTVVVTSVGLSNVLFPCLGGGSLIAGVWLTSSVRLRDLARQITTSTMWQIMGPLVTSTWTKAFVFFFFFVFVLAFFALEFVTRCVQRLRGKRGHNKWTTSRGAWLVKVLSEWNWSAVLEKAWILSTVFVVGLVIAARIVLVFMSCLNEFMEGLPLWQVLLVFYSIGIALCLAPFVPVVPIYMSSGIVIVARMQDKSGFWSGVFVASFMSLAMKLLASAVQQKLIGGYLGKYMWVQQRVGVHTVPTRALEMALQSPGLSLTKIAILCGGPDWVTSVMAGILRLNIVSILVGTLPVIFLIFPTVLAGACLVEEHLQKASPIVLLAMAIANATVFMLAFILTLKIATKNSEMLQESREEHKELEELANETAARKRDLWLLTRREFKVSEKWCLILAVALQLACVWVTFFVPSTCFRTFDLHSEISDSFDNKGLENSFFNLFRPAGYIVCLVSLVSAVCFSLHMCVKHRSRKDSDLPTPWSTQGPALAKRGSTLSIINEETWSQAGSVEQSRENVSRTISCKKTDTSIAKPDFLPTLSDFADIPSPPGIGNVASVPVPLRRADGSQMKPSWHLPAVKERRDVSAEAAIAAVDEPSS